MSAARDPQGNALTVQLFTTLFAGLYFSTSSRFFFSSSRRLEANTKSTPTIGDNSTHQKLLKLPITRLEPILAKHNANNSW